MRRDYLDTNIVFFSLRTETFNSWYDILPPQAIFRDRI